MAKIIEAQIRMFGRVFVCRKCKHKQRADPAKVRENEIICRFCQARAFRPKRKEKRIVK